jgi:hypothetical protein
MAKGAPKNAGALPKTTAAPAPAPAASKTTGSSPVPKPPGQKQAAGQPADQVGDICLLPDIARFAH